ncbi:MAG: hypothetical protein WAV28_11650, partial [Sedimentisphaerales bacterium]
MRGRVLESRTCALRIRYFTFQLTTYIYFLNPARRPQSRKGRLAADALRQRLDGVNPAPQSGQRGGVKEDYYVQ